MLTGMASAEGQRGRMRPGDRALECELIDRIKRRDVRAFEELYLDYLPRLRRFLSNLVRKPHVVEEVVSDTMMVVWERIDGFKGDSSLSTWIFAIAYRKALRVIARHDNPVSDNERPEEASADGNPAEIAEKLSVNAALQRALSTLSADHRAVVDLTYFQELSYREIAQVMACPVDTVKTRMYHARRHLRRAITGDKADWLWT